MAASLAEPIPLNDEDGSTLGVFSSRDAIANPTAIRGRRTGSLRVRSDVETRWLAPVVRDLDRLLALREGWDSYDAKPVRQEAAAGAIRFLARLGSDVAAPIVAPTSSGGVHLEWNTKAGALEIEIEPADRVSLLAVDARSGAEIEEESVSLTHFFAAIFPKVSYLIPRA